MSAQFQRVVTARLIAGEYDVVAPPTSTVRLLALLVNPEVDFRELEQAIGADPTLAAHVLRVAGSPGFSRRGQVGSLRAAITRVGTRNLLRIALSLKVSEAFEVPGLEALAAASWRLARRSAVYAAEVARSIGVDPEQAFLCGLLHTIGQPVVLGVAAEVAQTLRIPAPGMMTAELMERWYVPIGEAVACGWGLPEVVQAAVAWHRRPLSAPEHRQLVLITCVASFLATCERLSSDVLPMILGAHPVALALGIGPEPLIALLERDDLVAQAEALAA